MTTTQPPLSRRQQQTRLALMEAFLRLIAQRRIEQITVTAITDEANYGRWTFYQYFQSKEEVAFAAFTHWMTRLDAQVIAAVAHLEPPRREYISWRLIFSAFEGQRLFFIQVEGALATSWHGRVREFLVAQFLDHLRAGRFALMDGVRPEIAARLYVTAFIELLSHWARHPEIGDAQTLVDEFYRFIFNAPPPGLTP
jgi:AcrR family transcriptional regulator